MSASRSGPASSRHGRRWASRPREIRPARSSTFRCFEIAGWVIANGAASSPTEASPFASRARIARLVGSASAANVTSRLVMFETFRLYNLKVIYGGSISLSTVRRRMVAQQHPRGCATADHRPLPESKRLRLARATQGEVHERNTSMHLLWALIIGLVIGALAKLVMPGRDGGGILITMLLGVAGSIVANLLGHAAGWYGTNESAGFLATVLGAIVLLAIYRFATSRRALPKSNAARSR